MKKQGVSGTLHPTPRDHAGSRASGMASERIADSSPFVPAAPQPFIQAVGASLPFCRSSRPWARSARATCVARVGLAASFLLAAPAAALAGDAPPPFFDNWFANFAYALGIVYVAAKLFMYTRPRPPLHQQYAAADHVHADMVTEEDRAACRDEQARALLAVRQDGNATVEKIERQLDHIRNQITEQYSQIDSKLEGSLRRMHERLDPLPPAIAANTRSVETHLADHRAGRVN